MKDILFINPPNHSNSLSIPLGAAYLSQIVQENGFRTGILDLQKRVLQKDLSLNLNFSKKIKGLLTDNHSKIYGITVWNISYPWTVIIAGIIKSMYPDSKIIIGGPFATLWEDEILLENNDIDVVVVFEGEKIIVPLTAALLSKHLNDKSLSGVNNIYYRSESGSIVFTGEEPMIEDLDQLPVPDMQSNSYYKTNIVNLEVGRGCAYNCYFCSANYVWKKKPRFKSAVKIVETADYYCKKIKKNGLKDPILHFEHDNFLTNKKLFKEFIKIKKQRKLDFSYGFATRIDLLDDETINMLAQSSCRYVYCGIETGSDRMQKISKKNINLEKVVPTVRTLLKNNIYVTANFIVGFPEETLADLCKTLTLMAELKWYGAIIYASVLCPDPHTDIFKNSDLKDYILRTNCRYYKELKLAGIDPEVYNKQFASHLYTLKNSNFDISIIEEFLELFIFLLQFFPLSSYIIIKIMNQPVQSILLKFRSFFMENAINVTVKNVEEFILSMCVFESNNKMILVCEIVSFEAVNAHNALKIKYPKETMTFKHNINKLYRHYMMNPELLMRKLKDEQAESIASLLKYGQK